MSHKLIIAICVFALVPVGTVFGQNTYTDDFTYTHDFTTGVPGFNAGATSGSAIWQNVANAGNGGGNMNANVGTGTLQMFQSNVGWESANDSGPLLTRDIDMQQFLSVTVKITSQTVGNWSQAGPIVRQPNPTGDNLGNQENYYAGWSYRPGGTNGIQLQRNRDLNSAENESNVTTLTEADVAYIRIENQGVVAAGVAFGGNIGTVPGRTFRVLRSADGITFTPHTNVNVPNNSSPFLVSGLAQVGVAAGALGVLAGANAQIDSVTIVTGPTVPLPEFADCAAAGACVWNLTGNGNFVTNNNYNDNVGPATGQSIVGVGPNANTVAAVFGASITANSTVFLNTTRTVKELRFDNAGFSYALGGTGLINLDSDSGPALLTALSGTHQIQVDLSLQDDVTANAAAGATLAINTPVKLNGHTITITGTGTVRFNDGLTAAGGAGAGSLVNGGSVDLLGGLQGNLTQTDAGSLGVVVGGAPINVTGSAVLDGVLDVSLADGFTPVAGHSYTVLTADSVTDLGLSLGGSAGSLFHLGVGNGSVSLTAVPEPASLMLIGIGLAAIGVTQRRRRSATGFFTKQLGVMHKVFALVSTIVTVFAATTAMAQVPGTLLNTYTDNFGVDGSPNANTKDYTTGDVSGTIWSGILNPTKGGDGFFSVGQFRADGPAADTTDHAGKLYITDTNTFVNPNTTIGIGFEGTRSNAPFLYKLIQADHSFEAIAKVDAQTAGNWSYAPIIARLDGPATRNLGDAVVATEQYVTFGGFNAPATRVQRKNIINGAQNADSGADGNVPGGVIPSLYIRLTKIGPVFTTATSADGVTWLTPNNGIPAANNLGMNNVGTNLQIGPSYMRFGGGGTAGGSVDFDFFTIKEYSTPPPIATWNNNGSSNWATAGNWSSYFASGLVAANPNSNTHQVVFGSVITTPQTVYTNTDVTVKSLTFSNANKYAISGVGRITLAADTGPSAIDVQLGSHEIQTALTLNSATNITSAAATRLELNNEVNLNGQAVTVSGAGSVYFNNNIDAGANGTVASSGNIGGSGRINGSLSVSGGSVNPGSSAGTLTIDNGYTQTAGNLNIELGGTTAGTFDNVFVTGAASLAGVVDVSLISPFAPSNGNSWDIVTSTGALSSSMTVDAGDTGYSLSVVGNTLKLSFTGTGGVLGDYNGDGTVNAADYTVYRNRKAGIGGTTLNNEGPGITPGVVTVEDYNYWKSRYGATSGSGSGLGSGSVPEPTSVALCLLAGIGAFLGYRKR